jgi:hypothetical protein
MEARTTELIGTRSTLGRKFSFIYDSNQLHRIDLLTGELSGHQIPGYEFKYGCTWSELPGSLLLTGGFPGTKEVVKIDTQREWAVSSQPPMYTARCYHAAVYHSQYLYVLTGCSGRDLRECERYVCAESRWEELPALPVACSGMSVVELENSLYGLGGFADERLDTVQKLRLDSLTWEVMLLKLPQAASYFPCFKTGTQVYLVIKETLFSFTPLQVKTIKTVPQGIDWCLSSYYSRRTLYYVGNSGIQSLAVGELTSS